MKGFIIFLLIASSVAFLALTGLYIFPHLAHKNLIYNEWRSDWFRLKKFDRRYLKPDKLDQVALASESGDVKWQNFHVADVKVPLPAKIPDLEVRPRMFWLKDEKRTELGLDIRDLLKKELVKIRFLPNYKFTHEFRSQKIFTLPLVKNLLVNIQEDRLWEDIFSGEIAPWNKTLFDMAYDLYLLQMRSVILPSEFVGFRYLKKVNAGLIEIDSADKDYTQELIMKRHSSGMIISFVIMTLKKSHDAQKIRDTILKEISFELSTLTLGKIIYQEFKNLNYHEQFLPVGRLLYFSTWTQDISNEKLLKEWIGQLERSPQKPDELEELYQYALDKYDETFVTSLKYELNDKNIQLKTKIEREKREREKKEDEIFYKRASDKDALPTAEDLLRAAKENRKKKKVNHKKTEVNLN